MTRSQGRLLIFAEVGCLIAVVAGVAFVFSPLYVSGGLVGWRQHYDPNRDVLLLGWFASSIASVVIGLALMLGGGLLSIWIGLGAGLFALLRSKPKQEMPKNSEGGP